MLGRRLARKALPYIIFIMVISPALINVYNLSDGNSQSVLCVCVGMYGAAERVQPQKDS